MLTRADVTADNVANAPRIDRTEVRLLWDSDYWDGPLSGMLVYRGRDCWFEVVAESEYDAPGWYRRFVVLELTAEQLAEERRWHELFRENVGRHTDYDDQGGRPPGSLQPRERWHVFYDAHRDRTPADFSGNIVLGWFEW